MVESSYSPGLERRIWNSIWIAKDVLMQFHLPDRAEKETLRLLNGVIRKGATDGRRLEKTTACLLYYVCKEYDLPFTAHEIAEKLAFNKHSLLRSYFRLRKRLNLKEQDFDPSCLVAKYAYELGLEPMEEHEARQELKRLDLNTDPRIKVALAIYEASNRTQEEVAGALGITQEALSRFKRRAEEKLERVDMAVAWKSFRSGSPLSVQVS